MEIKYEAVFGDQSLFYNDIGDSVAAINHGDVVLCFNSYNAFLIEVMKCNDLPLSDVPEFAMRRIIKEPKHWTWEDKKAGRLPEVGWLVYSENDSKSALVIAKDHEGDIWFQCSCGVVRCTDGYVMLPIETPAEKAQREEDEFINSMLAKGVGVVYMSDYIEGLRAAYRKMKGGE